MRRQEFQLAPGREDARKDRRRARQGDVYHVEGIAPHADEVKVVSLAGHGTVSVDLETYDLYSHIQQVNQSSAKLVYLEATRTLLRDNLQPTWGRVQQQEEMEYERLVEEVAIFKRARSRLTRLSGNVLEEFEGFLDQFDGDVAHITLKTQSGETFYGEYPAAELKA